MSNGELIDSLGRKVRKARISVTDRCNFSCFFCMPSNPTWIPHEDLLKYEEITRIVSILHKLGVNEVKLTGGEPLVRRNITTLIDMINPIINDISMTTNGYYLLEMANELYKHGLKRVTISLHSLRRERYKEITGVDAIERVLSGIYAAKDVGLSPLKINSTIIKGYNDMEILDLLNYAIKEEICIRYIEFMPFDGRNFWSLDKVYTGEQIKNTILARYDLLPLERIDGSTSLNYLVKGTHTTVGFITSVSHPFCSDCDRLRVTARGGLVPCMFSSTEFDFKTLLRSGASDDILEQFFKQSVRKKFAGVESLLNKEGIPPHVRPMHTIGG